MGKEHRSLKYEGMSVFRPPLSRELDGKRFLLAMDSGHRWELAFGPDGRAGVSFDGTAKECAFECLKAADGVYLVNMNDPFVSWHAALTFILDAEKGLVTAARARIGQDPLYPRMPAIRFDFGAAVRPDGSLPDKRHGYTADLVGRAVNWNYGEFEIVHVYSSERYYRVAFSEKRLARMRAEAPERFSGGEKPRLYEDCADYIKIRDGLYVVSLLETVLCRRNGHGNSLLFVMDMVSLHDVGRSFGTNKEGNDENYTFGAFGEEFDASDVLAMPSVDIIR